MPFRLRSGKPTSSITRAQGEPDQSQDRRAMPQHADMRPAMLSNLTALHQPTQRTTTYPG